MNHTCLFLPSWSCYSLTDPGGMEGWVCLASAAHTVQGQLQWNSSKSCYIHLNHIKRNIRRVTFTSLSKSHTFTITTVTSVYGVNVACAWLPFHNATHRADQPCLRTIRPAQLKCHAALVNHCASDFCRETKDILVWTAMVQLRTIYFVL